MSRDYKGNSSKSSGGRGSAFLLGLLLGLVAGLGIAVAVAWHLNKSPSPFLGREKPAEARPVPPKAEPAKPAEPEKPKFTFYKILPGSEEPVSEQQLKEAARQQQQPRDIYFVQAGAFQNAADADNLKAKLALLGVEAAIHTATIPDKGTWHRVRIGPYASVAEVARLREQLKQSGIETGLIKAKEAP